MRFAIFPLLATLALAAPPVAFSSGSQRVRVLELFTSEGCSSCPPAEAWFATLRAEPGLWRDFVPLAWHVDYWDKLGWKDAWASREATARESAYASEWGSDTVYTPCLVLDGREARRRAVPAAAHETAGLLTARFADGRAEVQFAGQPTGSWEVHAALLGADIVSSVRAGENRGETLQHHFVVLKTASAPLREGHATLALPATRTPTAPRLALAVWVTARGQLTPVQATGGWL